MRCNHPKEGVWTIDDSDKQDLTVVSFILLPFVQVVNVQFSDSATHGIVSFLGLKLHKKKNNIESWKWHEKEATRLFIVH